MAVKNDIVRFWRKWKNVLEYIKNSLPSKDLGHKYVFIRYYTKAQQRIVSLLHRA